MNTRIWSLWEVLERYAMLFSRFMYGLYDFEKDYVWRGILKKGERQIVELSDAKFIAGYLEIALSMANELDLESVPPLIDRISKSLASEDYNIAHAARDLENLRDRILDQLGSRYFLFVKASRLDYYVKPELFGPDVAMKFLAANDDIEEAGKCLAVGQGTAAVMHLMRVVEVGLKYLAAQLSIPYAPSWESYLKQIEARITAKHKTKGIKWKRDEAFFRDVSGDLMTVKQAWRNPTMHVVRKYSAEEAEEIFKASRRLMQRLAERLPKS
jgi:hypothetical protein